MDIALIKTTAARGLGRGLLVAKKYSPEILTGVGIVGGVVASVMGAKATLKLEETNNQARLDIADVKHNYPEGDADRGKMLGMVYAKSSIEYVKLYGPSVSLGVASIGCILGAHGIMRQRQAAILAAYKTLEAGYSEYRKRVEGALGEVAEYELANDVKETEVVDENGKKQKVKLPSKNAHNMYSVIFDEGNANWSANAEYHEAFILGTQNMMNDLLKARGHVLLNDVYDALGFDRTKAGSVVGWVIGGGGDDYIDFNVFNLDNEQARNFVNGWERAIILDFNVDGIIYDKI